MTNQDLSIRDELLPGVTLRRRMILVSGMHRSGTSAVTRALNLCGASVPSDLLEATSANPDGYWESRLVTMLHDELLASIGFSWDDIREFPSGWFHTAAAAQYRDRLWQAVKTDVMMRSPLLLKDPRLCRLLPLWFRIAEEHDLELSVVIPLRNPLDVAESLWQRDKMPQSKALLLWLRHFLETERATRGAHRHFVAYERLIGDGVATISATAHALGLAASPLPLEATELLESFLNETRWHHRTPDDLVPDWVKPAYDWGLKATRGDDPDPAMLDATGDGLRAAEEIHRPLIELIEVRDARIIELERHIARKDIAGSDVETAQAGWNEERTALHEERTALYQERTAIYEERSKLYEERSKLYEERRTFCEEQVSLQVERGTLQNERTRLEGERSLLLEERHTLRDERTKLGNERSSLHDERGILQTERRMLYQDRSDLLAAREALLDALSQAEQTRQAMRMSTSWRITAPLRSLKRLGRGKAV